MVIMMVKTLVSGVFVHDKKIGLLRNYKEHKKNSTLPIRLEPVGGKIEDNETVEDAMHREVVEELQRTCTIIRKLCVAVTHSTEGSFDAHMLYIDIDGDYTTLTTHEPSKLDGIVWLNKKELQEWCKHPPANFLIVPNVSSSLEYILPLLE